MQEHTASMIQEQKVNRKARLKQIGKKENCLFSYINHVYFLFYWNYQTKIPFHFLL